MKARLCLVAFLLGSIFIGASSSAAHPLGNFSISHYSAIRIGRDAIALRYVIDMAEIPTFQEIQESGIVAEPDDPRVEAYLARKLAALGEGLALEVNEQRVPLNVESKEIIFPPGAGGLPTMKIGVVYKGKFETNSSANSQLQLTYRDVNFPGRAGWKEIIAMAESGANILNSSVPQSDRTTQLNNYPTDLLNSPPQDLEARLMFMLPAVAPPAASVPRANALAGDSRQKSADVHERSNGRESPALAKFDQPERSKPVPLQANAQATPRNSFTELMATRQLGLGIILIALAVAVGLGAFHALEPGHGKTLVAAYLVGSRGTFKHALLLGLIVTATHTAGVYLLGAVTLYASRYIVPDRLYPWLGVVSGVMIATLGLILLVRRCLGKGGIVSHHHRGHPHHHHHGPGHDHEHHHPGGHSHRHHGEAKQNVSLKELLALGISGGIVPCPAALVVLLSAVSTQRIGFGLLLVVAFSVGLAAVLIAIGLLMVYARRFMSRFRTDSRVVTHWLPLTSSAFILLFGVALTVQALQTAGILGLQLWAANNFAMTNPSLEQ